ncbi:MAG TPA: glycoside hydrolase family 3 N-terminal domain-containing protein, partial [Balneolales bacterium]|nr:glycoside hydrolase family 3 N-terminal domain-containing protein [Balneolales bacterium]
MKTAIIFSALFLLLPLSLLAQKDDYRAQAEKLVSQMTLEEKASLCSGLDFWQTKPIKRLDIPSIFMTDGPSGLRKSEGSGIGKNVPATCFPTGSAMAATWDMHLEHEVGSAMGLECQANNVQILLAPGVNMKRSPLNGRNFEYFSEDPYLAGKMGTAFVEGVQSQGVGTSLKHFDANNQEYERMIVSSDVDQRTLHEMYLPAFEMVVKEAHPWTVMCAYNKVNGVYASEDPYLLDTVLRKDWGYKGMVVSDWGAVDNRVEGLKAGLNLEMPGNGGINDRKIVEAVKNGTLDPKVLDQSVTDVLAIILRAHADHRPGTTYSKEKHNALARAAADEAIVLLKNDNNILPLNSRRSRKIAVIGGMAKSPHFEGGGSSEVNPTEVANPYDELEKSLGHAAKLSYAQGYVHDDSTSNDLLHQAQSEARKADVAI